MEKIGWEGWNEQRKQGGREGEEKGGGERRREAGVGARVEA